MANYCILTGVELSESQPSPIKKMCLNCASLVETEPGVFACQNKSVMEKGREKILAAVPEGFEIETLTLKPMLLKNPTKKCANHESDIERITEAINGIFV